MVAHNGREMAQHSESIAKPSPLSNNVNNKMYSDVQWEQVRAGDDEAVVMQDPSAILKRIILNNAQVRERKNEVLVTQDPAIIEQATPS